MRYILLIIITASLLSCDQKPKESPSVSFEKDLEALKEYFHIPGMAAIITQDGKVIYENYFGYADLKTKRFVDSTTIFPIASVTKIFSTVLLMQLVEAGDLDLNEPISNYLENSNLSDAIKIKHVLSHTSEGTPGSFFNYSRRFALLTEVVEKVSRKSLEVLMKDKVLRPQGLDNTFSIARQATLDSLTNNLAKPYYYFGEIEDGHYDVGMSTATGLASTVRDIAKFDNALESGALISDKNKREMFSPFRTSIGISPYGLGIFSQAFLGKQIIWGFGQEDCFSSLILKVLEDDFTLVLLANNNLMSDPARLINGDITYSLFALSFLKHFVFDIPRKLDWTNVNYQEDLDFAFDQNDYGPFYRQELLANAIAASFIGRTDSAEVERSRELAALALENFSDYESYGSQSLMILLLDLATHANDRKFDHAIESLGEALLEKHQFDPYVNVSLGDYYGHRNEKEKALEHYERITEAENFEPNWYTIEALDFLGEYYKQQNPELAKRHFQKIVDIGWNMGGLLDKAKKELKEL